MKILFEDPFIAVVIKQANMPSQPDKTKDADLTTKMRNKAGYAAIINRLDRVVGGIVVFAYDKLSAASLSKQLDTSFTKEYAAVVCGNPKKEAALDNWLIKNERLNISKIVNRGTKGSVFARLEYSPVKTVQTAEFGSLSLINVELLTGRHHQIRVQLSNAGIPIWGDTKYNQHFDKGGMFYKAALDKGLQIMPALWSMKVCFNHPNTGERLDFCKRPDSWPFNLFY